MKKNKCNVVMLSTEKASRIVENIMTIHIKKEYTLYLRQEAEFTNIGSKSTKNQHLYIISNDEIKDNDWCYDKILNTVFKTDKFTDLKYINQTDNVLKVIATTDPELIKDGVAKIGLPFIEKYITEYNKNNVIKEVNVEYEILKCAYTKNSDGSSQCSESPNCMDWAFSDVKQPENTDCNHRPKLKLRSDGTIIIHKVQEMFTKEDLFKSWKTVRLAFVKASEEVMRDEFEEWFEQNY